MLYGFSNAVRFDYISKLVSDSQLSFRSFYDVLYSSKKMCNIFKENIKTIALKFFLFEN